MPRYLKEFITALTFLLCSSTLVLAQSDRYLHFDGINDFAEVPNASQYFVGASGISMTGWFCSSALGYGHGYFGFRGPGNGLGQMYVIELNGGTLECRYISTTGFNEYVAPAGTVQPGVWQHVAWTYTGTSSELYINGQFIGSTPSTGTFTSTTRSFGLGKSIENGFNFVFSGRMDEVTVWSKGLSQAEILDIMANELTGTEANLELYYKMNQGLPGGNNTAITQLISEVGPGPRNANLSNFTLNGATSNFNISNEDPSFTVTDYCVGTPNQATLLGTPGGSFSFQNAVIDGATIDPLTGAITGGVAGTTYTVQYTTNGTCPITETHDLTVHNSPQINTIIEQCAMDETSYTVSFEILDGDPSSYSVIGGGTVTGNTFTSDPIPSGTPYSFTVSDVNACGTDQVTGEISCICPASAIYSEDVIICQGEVGVITIEFSGNGPWALDYEIDGVPQAQISTALDVYDLLVTEAGTYAFTTISDANCSNEYADPLTVQVAVYDLPTASMTGGTAICEGESVELEVELTGAGPWELIIALDGIPEPSITALVSPYIFSATEAGVYSITSLEDVNCSGMVLGSTELIVHDLPEASISGNLTFCQGTEASLEIILSGEPEFTLTYSIDGIIQPPLTIDQPSPFILNTDIVGTYELLALSDANCEGSVSGVVAISELELPTAMIETASYTICSSSSQALEVQVTGSADWTIVYSIDGIPQPSVQGSTNPVVIGASAPGTYLLISVEDALCPNAAGNEQVVIEHYPPISISYSEGVELCQGEDVELWVEAMGGLGDTYSYAWQVQYLLSSNGNTAIYSPPQTELIAVTINEACDYNQTFTIPVIVHQLPPISISAVQSLCGPDIITLTNTTPSSFVGGDCLWTIEGETFTDCAAVDYFFGLGSYDIGLEVTSPEGCYNALIEEDFIQVNPPSIADFSVFPSEVTTAEPVVSFTNTSVDADGFLWNFGNEAISTAFEPEFDFGTRAGLWRICLTAENEFGCQDSVCQFIRVKSELLVSIPNSFTPDDDGVNDFFFPILYGADESDYLFSIYDRSGRIVYESTDVHERWNGSYYMATEFYTQDAIFTYRLRARALGSIERQLFSGSVLMLR